MFIALVIGAVLLAAMCVSSASMKLRRHEQAVAITGGTVTGHLRVGDTKNLTMPLPPLVLCIAVLVLRLVTA